MSDAAHPLPPLLTAREQAALLAARGAGGGSVQCSLDLGRSRTTVQVDGDGWTWNERRFPLPESVRERTVYAWTGTEFEPVARYRGALVKLVPTDWGAPTFEIDGIKMLPTSRVSPYEDARRKVDLVQPRGRRVLDTCGGLGYFGAWCLKGGAAAIRSYEKNPDVLWLRSLNPWSPDSPWWTEDRSALALAEGDVTAAIGALPDASFDAALHDPPRFGIAGELYSAAFYAELYRVLTRGARLFHYTGTPNRLTSGRDVPNEVATRLKRAGFTAEREGDGVLAIKGRSR
jgi:predicted methyltransferase